MRRTLLWIFQNRETGAITIAQAPNLILWVVIVAAGVGWLHPAGRIGMAAAITAKGGLVLWALDEIIRGVNPWRRFLGAAVIATVLATLLA